MAASCRRSAARNNAPSSAHSANRRAASRLRCARDLRCLPWSPLPDILNAKGRAEAAFSTYKIRQSLLWQQALALHAFALKLAVTPDRFGPFAGPLLARLFVVAPQLHLAEDAFPLHLLLQRLQRLVDIVVANDDLQRPGSLEFPELEAGLYQSGHFLSIPPRGPGSADFGANSL